MFVHLYEKTIKILRKNDVIIHRITFVTVPDKIRESNIAKGYAHWNKTFEKFLYLIYVIMKKLCSWLRI